MKSRPLSLAPLVIFGALSSTACDRRAASDTLPPLPNSIADTSVRPARHPIPTYGPPENADSVLTYEARGQVLYVSVYSHIFPQSEVTTFSLATTLSIRNTSPTSRLTLHEVDYFDSSGTLLKSYLERPRSLEPLASTYVVIDETDRTGGVGANFIVTWRAEQPIARPVVESVMISTHSGQGISFTSPARVLQEW